MSIVSTLIATFEYNGKNYSIRKHLNDSTYLESPAGLELLEITEDGEVYELTPTRVCVGSLSHQRGRTDSRWVYTDKVTGEETMGSSTDTPNALLADGITFFKTWIQNHPEV